jgi:hypothetical protein
MSQQTMSKQKDMELSLITNSVLDNLGFSKKQIMLRSLCIGERFKFIPSFSGFTALIAGSSGEGVPLADSDINIMNILRDVICVDSGFDNHGELIILGTDYSETAPGYTRVVSISIPDNLLFSPLFHAISVYDTVRRENFLSSEKMRFSTGHNRILLNVRQRNDIKTDINGPSVTLTYSTSLHSDFVDSIYFYGGNYLQKWKNRIRINAWPSARL